MHGRAMGLVEDQQMESPGKTQDKDWSSHVYLALRHLLKLKLDEDILHNIVEAKQGRCKLHNAMHSTRKFYVQLEFRGSPRDSTLQVELTQTQFPEVLVITADTKEHTIRVRIYVFWPLDSEGHYCLCARVLTTKLIISFPGDFIYVPPISTLVGPFCSSGVVSSSSWTLQADPRQKPRRGASSLPPECATARRTWSTGNLKVIGSLRSGGSSWTS